MQEFAPVIAFVGILIFMAHLFTGIFSRTKIPDVLLLIIIGIGIGPVLGMASPSQFGIVGPIFTTITLIIILFESGLTLRLSALRSALSGALTLAPLSFFLTMTVVAGLVLLLTDLEVMPALILGAIIGSTSEAVVIPLIKQLRISEETRTLLSVESSVNDVLSIVITVALIQAYGLGEFNIASISGTLIAAFLVAIVFGVVGALVWSTLLNRIHAIKNAVFTTPAFVFVLFGVMEILGFSGAIAALAFGITIGNIESIHFSIFNISPDSEPVSLTEYEKAFFSEIAFLLKTFFFVYLGISLELISNWLILVGIIITIVAFILRILAVRVSIKKSVPVTDISIAAIMIPKGLAAVVLATIPFQQGVAGGELIKNITYGVVLISIVATSLLVLLIERTRFSDFYTWLLSPGFPRLRPKIVPGPKNIAGETDGIVTDGARLFGHPSETGKSPNGDNETSS
ncbi:MAG: cation:proton antiporter [Dehalococcoidales bacterium]